MRGEETRPGRSSYGVRVANDTLTYEQEGTTAIVRMDDGKANALSKAMLDALLESLARAEKEATAMVLVGRPERFCAGFDLKVMMASPESAVTLLRQGADAFMKFYGSPIPIVMACTGHALAAGALLLLTGDVRIGTEGAYRLGLNEVSIGLPVPVLAMELARDRLEKTELGHATLSARIYDPKDAARVGYLDAALPADAVLARAKEEAAKLGAFPRAAYSATKTRLRKKTIDYILGTLEEDLKGFGFSK
jgi:enoyl-CoA hydratase